MDVVYIGRSNNYGDYIEFSPGDVKGECDGTLYVESDGQIVPVVPGTIEELIE